MKNSKPKIRIGYYKKENGLFDNIVKVTNYEHVIDRDSLIDIAYDNSGEIDHTARR